MVTAAGSSGRKSNTSETIAGRLVKGFHAAGTPTTHFLPTIFFMFPFFNWFQLELELSLTVIIEVDNLDAENKFTVHPFGLLQEFREAWNKFLIIFHDEFSAIDPATGNLHNATDLGKASMKHPSQFHFSVHKLQL